MRTRAQRIVKKAGGGLSIRYFLPWVARVLNFVISKTKAITVRLVVLTVVLLIGAQIAGQQNSLFWEEMGDVLWDFSSKMK